MYNYVCLKKQILIIIIIYLFLSGCNKLIDNSETVCSIDLEHAFNNIESFSEIEILSEVKYIRLQTDKECIITGYPRFCCDNDFIISNSFRKIILFNKKTGAFHKEIGEYDKGPNGYRYTIIGLFYNEENKLIYSGDWDYTLSGYNFNNKKVFHLDYPAGYMFMSVGYINDSIYAGFPGVQDQIKNTKVVVFNKEGKILNIFPNFLPYNNSDNFRGNPLDGFFYRADGNLNLKEIYNDTLFQIKADTLIPRYFFKMGKYAPPPEQRGELEKILTRNELGMVTMKLDNYIVTKTICESTRYLFFEFDYKNKDYWGVYDKKKEETHIQRNEDNIKINGIEMPFRLTRAFINQENQELITFIDAYQLENWIKNNPEKVKALPAEIHQELIKVNSTDNPVVMIAKLKE